MCISRLGRWLPSPALMIACVALFAALGGSTYAATTSGDSIHFTNAKLEGGWTIAGFNPGKPGYAKDSLGVVHLRGAVANGTGGSVAFVLPKGLRPAYHLYLPIYTAGYTEGSLDIEPGGDVAPFGTESSSYSSLNGVSFVAGQ